MPRNRALDALTSLRSNWRLATQAGAWMAAVAGGFLLPPPRDISAGEASSALFVPFLLAVTLGLLALPVARFRAKRHAKLWAAISLASLCLGVAALFLYRDLRAAWSVEFEGERVVIGREDSLTALGKAYRAQHPEAEPRQIVRDTSGRPQVMWTAASIRRNTRLLEANYMACSVLFAVAVIGMLQATQSTGAAKRRARKTKGART
jgi:hypothetical protein